MSLVLHLSIVYSRAAAGYSKIELDLILAEDASLLMELGDW